MMTGFICHDDYLSKLTKFTDEEVGRLFRALMVYHATGEETKLEMRESIAFDFIREDIDRTESAYKAKCEKNRENRLTAINERKRTITNVDERQPKQTKKKETSPWFERFWAAYPRHVNKPAAMRAFDKAKVDETLLETILKAIERQKGSAQWQENGGQFIPHPATWLNGKRWEDEVTEVKKTHGYEQRDYDDEQEEAMKRMLGVMG